MLRHWPHELYRFIFKGLGPVSLRYLLVLPFVLQIFTAVGLTGWLSLRNGQRAVNEVATQLRDETTASIEQRLDSYLAVPQLINQLNADAFRLGELAIADHRAMERHFALQLQAFEAVSYIYMGSTDGGIIAPGRRQDGSLVIEVTEGFTVGDYDIYASDAQGERGPLLSSTPGYDARLRPWYTTAVEAGKPAWGDIYLYFADQELGIPASQPLYNETGDLQGVLAVDLLLSQISQFLQELQVGYSGQSFILERSGLVVASSVNEGGFVAHNAQGEPERVQALDSESLLLQASTQQLIQSFGALDSIQAPAKLQFELENGDYSGKQFLQVTPFGDRLGLDWLVVVVVPEAEFMATIQRNRQLTILLCLTALLVASLLGILTARIITQPILKLNQASQAIAAGDLEQKITVQGIDELEHLASSFNTMAEQLKNSFLALKTVNLELEDRVDQRTAELTKAKETAESANQAKSLFLSRMSHELRTPLNAILGFTQLIQGNDELPPQVKEYISIIDGSSEHLLELVNDVLSFSKIESGQIDLNPSCFAWQPMLESLCRLFSLRAREKGLNLSLDLSLDLPSQVEGDEAKLRQVLINLLGNAIKFTHHGTVSLTVRRQEKQLAMGHCQLQFEVKDTGVGIPPEEIDSLFDVFAQGQVQINAQEGTGLGLSITQQLVALMGGELKLSSTVGQGTRCQFALALGMGPDAKPLGQGRLNLRQETAPAATQSNPEVHAPQSAGGHAVALAPGQPSYRILVAEDNKLNRLLLVKSLLPMGFELYEAENGQEAIEGWQSWQPHAILMDMQMPIMAGDEATRWIRQQASTSDSSLKQPIIIALTASAWEKDRLRSLEAGCDDFLAKPCRRETLLNTLAQHLGIVYTYG